jgi:Uma2 family endonuclease
MGLPRGHHRYIYADYVALELESSTRHEFLDGEIYAMAGGSEDHSALSAQVLRALGNALGDRRVAFTPRSSACTSKRSGSRRSRMPR